MIKKFWHLGMLIASFFSSCVNKKDIPNGDNHNQMKMRKIDRDAVRFSYGVTCSSSQFFPIEYVDVDFISDSGALSVFGNNIISPGMGCGFDGRAGLEDEDFYLPKLIEATWVSYVDRKSYALSALLPYDTILSLFRGVECGDKENPQFNDLDLCFLPDGKVMLYLKAPGEVVLLDWFAIGEESYEHASEVYKTRGCNNLDEFFEDYVYSGKFKEDHLWLSYIKKHGSPSDMLNRYLQRFNYIVNFDFEDKCTSVESVFSKYTNGEIHSSENKSLSKDISRVKEIKAEWSTKDYYYTCFMYFNEEEMLRVFDEAYGEDRTQKGEFKIKVGKDNNLFDISLNVGDKSFKLKNTEIRVFQEPIDNNITGNGTLIYKNYEGNHKNRFADDKKYVVD